jgi:hypothetical protein
MNFALERPGFTVRLCGAFIEPGLWLIHGAVEYAPRSAMDSASDIEAEARRELMLAVSRASRSARAIGARSVYVVVDGDEEVAGFFRISNRRASRPGKPILPDRIGLSAIGP